MNISEYLFKIFWDYYKVSFNETYDVDFIEQCQIFIKNYLNEFEKNFYNNRGSNFMSFSPEENEMIIAIFESCGNGNISKKNKLVDQFIRRVFNDLNKKIMVYLATIKHPVEASVEVLRPHISKNICDLLFKNGFETIQHLIYLNQDEVCAIPGISESVSFLIIDAVHSLGCVFDDEKDDVNKNKYTNQSIKNNFKGKFLDPVKLRIVRELRLINSKENNLQRTLADNRIQLSILLKKIEIEEKSLKELEKNKSKLMVQLQSSDISEKCK